MLSPADAGAVHERQRPPRARRGDRQAADRDSRHRQPRSGKGTSAPASSTRRATSASTASGRQSGAARIPVAVVRGPRPVDQAAAPRDHAQRGVSVEQRALAGELRQGFGQPAVLARQPSSYDRRTGPRFAAHDLRRARSEDGRAVRAAHAVVQSPHRLRHGQPLRLDDYLPLFDFPSPNLSSERRFTTNVPLQRLFFMNSDFMQQQGELLARRLESEADATARIQKAYRLIFGRARPRPKSTPGSSTSERAAAGVRGTAGHKGHKGNKGHKGKTKEGAAATPDDEAGGQNRKPTA